MNTQVQLTPEELARIESHRIVAQKKIDADAAATLARNESIVKNVNQHNADRKVLATMAAGRGNGLLIIKTWEASVTGELPDLKSIHYDLYFTAAGKEYIVWIQEQTSSRGYRSVSKGYKYRWNADHNERQVWLTNPDTVVAKVKEFIKRKEDEVARENETATKETEMLAAAKVKFPTALSIEWTNHQSGGYGRRVHTYRQMVATFQYGKAVLGNCDVAGIVIIGAEPNMSTEQRVQFVMTGQAN